MPGKDPSSAWPLIGPSAVLRTGQIAFGLLFAWKVVEAGMLGQDIEGAALVGLLISISLWPVCLAVSWEALPRWLPGVVLGADLALTGLGALGVPGSSVILVMVPAVCVVLLYGRQAVPLVAGGVVLAVTVPTVFRHGPTSLDAVRGVVTPVMATAAAITGALFREFLLARYRSSARQQQRFEALLDTVDVGLIVLDETGLATSSNRRQQELAHLVYPRGSPDRTGVPGELFTVDGVTPLAVSQLPTVRAIAGEEFDAALMWCGADPATRRAVSVSSRVVWTDDGRSDGAVLAYTDVTELLRAMRDRDAFAAAMSATSALVGTNATVSLGETGRGEVTTA